MEDRFKTTILANLALAAAGAALLADGVCRVDDDIEDYLIEIAWHAHEAGQGRVEIGLYVRDVLPRSTRP